MTENSRDMPEDKCRETFEAWYGGKGCKSLERSDTNNYRLMQTHLSWRGWQAGWLYRADLVTSNEGKPESRADADCEPRTPEEMPGLTKLLEEPSVLDTASEDWQRALDGIKIAVDYLMCGFGGYEESKAHQEEAFRCIETIRAALMAGNTTKTKEETT